MQAFALGLGPSGQARAGRRPIALSASHSSFNGARTAAPARPHGRVRRHARPVFVAESDAAFEAAPEAPAAVPGAMRNGAARPAGAPTPAPTPAPAAAASAARATAPAGVPAIESFRAIPNKGSSKPLLFYIPGIDGTGKSCFAQRSLFTYFDVVSIRYPVESRAGWDELVAGVGAVIEREAGRERDGAVPPRAVYVFGESFGGALAMRVAAAYPSLVDRLLLLNPGSSYKDMPTAAIWQALPRLPEQVYNNIPLAMTPILISPQELGRDPVRTIRSFMRLPRVLPNATLAHRITLLQDFSLPQPHELQQPTLVLASERDLLLPSTAEARLLVRRYPSAQSRVLPGAGHAAMQENGVDILGELLQAGFLGEEGAAGRVEAARAAARGAAVRGAVDPRAAWDEEVRALR
eukprot:tig00021680_g23021.t1